YHAVYAGSCTSWTGTNMLFQRISGWGVQFNGNQQGNPTGSKIGQVTVDQAHGGVGFWNGAAVNEVDKALFTNFGSAGSVTTGGSHGTNPAVDYVTAPKPGYGYQAPGVVPTPAQATAAFLVASATVQGWRKAGKTEAWIKGQCCGNVYFALGGK